MIGIGGKNIVDYNSAWLFFMIYLHIVLKAVFVLFFRIQCWSHFNAPVHGRECLRGSIPTPSYKVMIVYTFHLSNCTSFSDNATCEYCCFMFYVIHQPVLQKVTSNTPMYLTIKHTHLHYYL